MGRPKKTDRVDDFDDRAEDRYDPRAEGREQDREDDLEMFTDSAESPLYIPKEWWPEGQEMRWISVEVTGNADNRNWSVKTAAHWVPYKRGTVAQIDDKFPVIAMPGAGPTQEVAVVFGGLCLCQRDRRYGQRDKKNQQKATQDAARTIDAYVEGGNSNFPRRDFSSPVQYERGVRPAQFKE